LPLLPLHGLSEALAGTHAAIEIVRAQLELEAARVGEDPLECLGPHLDSLEFRLLIGIPTVRCIPVPVIFESPPLRAGNAPMGNLVQRTREIIFPVEDPVRQVCRR
jgi:hypothetical protein